MVTQVKENVLHLNVEVEYVPGFKRNLLSYVTLARKGVKMIYEGEKRYLVSRNGTKMVEVQAEGDVLVVRGKLSGALANATLVCNIVARQEHVSESVHADTLFNWHVGFGHQSYDSIEALAAKPDSGIKLTDRIRPNCMTCAEGKQTKNNESKKDSGANSPIDRVGGVSAQTSRDESHQLTARGTVILSSLSTTRPTTVASSWPRPKTKERGIFSTLWVISNAVLTAEFKS
jgi:hypothetical protein